MDIFDAKVHTARSNRLAESIVCIVLVMREHLFPPLYQALRHRLRTDVHQPPLGKLIILQPDIAPVYRIQNVLRPRHEKPHNRALLLWDGIQDKLRFRSFQQDRLPAFQEAAKPVHLSARMVQRRNAQEHILPCLPMVVLLHLARMHQTLMVM